LGYGGAVDGEEIRCPFHGFRFSIAGRCTHNPYGSPPPAARLGILPVREQYGAIFVYSGPEQQAPWPLPPDDSHDWQRPQTRLFRFRGHPQEVTENSVDLGHLRTLHGFGNVRAADPLATDGATLKAGYSIRRRIVGSLGVDATFAVTAAGLGVSVVDLSVPALHCVLRLLVLPTPRSEGEIDLRIAVSAPRPHSSRMLNALVSAFVVRVVLAGFAGEVRRDIDVWKHKVYLGRPAIADGDGPVGKYRAWARQFYSDAPGRVSAFDAHSIGPMSRS
jgi:hypothetical protein